MSSFNVIKEREGKIEEIKIELMKKREELDNFIKNEGIENLPLYRDWRTIERNCDKIEEYAKRIIITKDEKEINYLKEEMAVLQNGYDNLKTENIDYIKKKRFELRSFSILMKNMIDLFDEIQRHRKKQMGGF